MVDEDELLTTREAAIRLGVSDSRVRQLVRDGVLVATKPGHDLLIRSGDLAAMPRRKPGRPPRPSANQS